MDIPCTNKTTLLAPPMGLLLSLLECGQECSNYSLKHSGEDIVKYMFYAYATKVQMVNIIWPQNKLVSTLYCKLWVRLSFLVIVNEVVTFKGYWKPVIIGTVNAVQVMMSPALNKWCNGIVETRTAWFNTNRFLRVMALWAITALLLLLQWGYEISQKPHIWQ